MTRKCNRQRFSYAEIGAYCRLCLDYPDTYPRDVLTLIYLVRDNMAQACLPDWIFSDWLEEFGLSSLYEQSFIGV